MSPKFTDRSKKALALVAALAYSGSALANDVIALQINGVPGDAGFASANGLPASSIEVSSLSGGISNALSIATQTTGGGAGKATLQNLNLLTHFGASSPYLFLSTANGAHYNTATVAFYHVNNAGVATQYYTITLTTALVVSESFAGAGGTPLRADTVNVSFAYGAIQLTDNNTGATVCWSAITNSTC